MFSMSSVRAESASQQIKTFLLTSLFTIGTYSVAWKLQKTSSKFVCYLGLLKKH